MDRYAESFANELQAFVKAVLEGSPTPVSGIDGRIPVVMGLAARKSHDEHRAVRLEEIRERYDSHCLGSGGSRLKRSTAKAILTDGHFWIPLSVLVLGVLLLIYVH